jgi:hypothetical protein
MPLIWVAGIVICGINRMGSEAAILAESDVVRRGDWNRRLNKKWADINPEHCRVNLVGCGAFSPKIDTSNLSDVARSHRGERISSWNAGRKCVLGRGACRVALGYVASIGFGCGAF